MMNANTNNHDQFAPMRIPRTRNSVKLDSIGINLPAAASVFRAPFPVALDPRPPALVVEAALRGTFARLGLPARGRRRLQCLGHHGLETFDGTLAVLELTPLVGDDDVEAAFRVEPVAETVHRSLPLPRVERTRPGDVEDQFDARLTAIDVLATRSARARDTKRQLVERNRQAAADTDSVHLILKSRLAAWPPGL